MKYLKSFAMFENENFSIPSKWKLNPETGCYDVQGSVSQKDLASVAPYGKLTVSFGKVTGDFNCSGLRLQSLKGSPQYVGGNFDCSYNFLGENGLEGCPEEIGWDFVCTYSRLKSLKGVPEKIGGSFKCSENLITSLKEGPKSVGGNYICNNNQLKTLEGCPQNIPGDFYCGG